ncbi:hypothetical protein RB195_016242 [Necator americanus]|uniref:Uncharacterized protein n=1 Tax=Necator americanus TaxID=51031 RepID=A0ABR1E8C3_NECAM
MMPLRDRVTLKRVDQRKRLNVSDLFKSLGRWNDLYARVIALNSLVFSSGQLHYSFKRSLSWKRSEFGFYDCEGNHYTLLKQNVSLFLETQYGESAAKFTKDEFVLFSEGGEAIGLLLLIALYRMRTPQILSIGAMLYSICPGMHLTRSKSFARASIFLSGVASRMLRIPTMVHCMESLPRHLRVYALPIMFASGVIFNQFIVLFSKKVHYSLFWTHVMVASFIVMTCFLHVKFAPPSIMHTLLHADSNLLKNELEKWVPEGQLINIDSLIDHILYRGPVFTSQMRALTNLLAFGPLVRKAVICAFLLPLGMLIFSSATAYLDDRLNFGIYETDFISNVLSILGLILTVYLCTRYERRFTMAIMLALAIVSQVVLLNIRLEVYNACMKTNIPQAYRMTIAKFAYVCAMMSSIVVFMVPRMVLMEHVPTSLRTIVPLAFLVATFVSLCRTGVQFMATRLPDAYPNATLIYSLGYTLFVAPFALLIDNSTHLPINTAEIAAYTPPRKEFPQNIEPSDIPSEHFSVRMMLQACAAAEETKMNARTVESSPVTDRSRST